MRINKFSFRDNDAGWELAETKFDDFNLLVGPSGAGKTRILKALEYVLGLPRNPTPLRHVSWTLEFDQNDRHFEWTLNTRRTAVQPHMGALSAAVIVESEIVRVNGTPHLERTESGGSFQGQTLPQLRQEMSSLGLIKSDELSLMWFGSWFHVVPTSMSSRTSVLSTQDARALAEIPTSPVGSVAASGLGLLAIVSGWNVVAYRLQEGLPAHFERLLDAFRDIFPTVESLRVARERVSATEEHLFLVMREQGVDRDIREQDLSVGMVRTWQHLLQVATSPPGTVVFVDEIENGLGSNCMPQVIEAMKSRAGEVQYILTSHHPNIIDNVDSKHWRLVRREGGRVWLSSATDSKAFDPGSLQEPYVQLRNLEEYEDAIR